MAPRSIGNPGKLYRGTRHNVGFEMLDFIAESEGISMSTASFKSSFGRGFIGDVPVMLAKPQTFMNASGESVDSIVSYYKISLKQVLVMFDDLDLPFANYCQKGDMEGIMSIFWHLDQVWYKDSFLTVIILIYMLLQYDKYYKSLQRYWKVSWENEPCQQEELDFTFQNGLEAIRILGQGNYDKSATFVKPMRAAS